MSEKIALEEALDEFGYDAPSLVAKSDRVGLKKLYSRLTAAAQMNREPKAAIEMREVLRKELSALSQRIRRGLFDDL